jgi:hypothetical protein
MALVFNVFTGTFDYVGTTTTFLTPVANEVNLPLTDPDGSARVVLATDRVYVFKLSSTTWYDTGLASAAFDATTNANGFSIANVIASGIARPTITLHPADGTNPGGVSTTTQTFAGDKTFSGQVLADGGLDTNNATLNIGTTTASTINIGRAGATVNFTGTTVYENVTNLNVTSKFITINKGGAVASGGSTGIDVEEAGSVTGYINTSSDRNSWLLKAPNTAGIATITAGPSGITLNQSSHDPVTIGTANGLSLSTQALSLGLASSGVTGALSGADWITFNGKLSPTLSSGNIFVGSVGNVATGVTMSGDATIIANGTLSLKSVGTPGTYSKVTTDAQGRVSSATNINAGDVTTALTYTPLNRAGDTMSGTLAMGGNNISGIANLTATGTTTLATALGGVLKATAGVVSSIALTDGQIVIGSTASGAAAGSIGAGTGITVTPGSNSISIGLSVAPSSGDIKETSFTAADNQGAAANITGFTFANATVRSFEATLSIVRGATYAQYKLFGIQKVASWELSQNYIGDLTGLTFTMTSAGQIQYTSTSTGSTATVKFRAITTTV